MSGGDQVSVDARFDAEWRQVAAAIGLARETTARLGGELAARHREPQRHYHTIEHVVAVIDRLDDLAARSPVTVLAAFFHDAIYDPRAVDNEERSADLAAAWLPGHDLAPDVVTLIVATAGHALPDDPPAGAADFLDADLAILGADPAVYSTYATAIRLEYAHLPDALFRQGRAAVLQTMLDRPALFLTEAGHARWDRQARTNIAEELSQL